MTLGVKWVYSQNDTYKSAETVVHSLVDVVATGGSLLLDVGPVSVDERLMCCYSLLSSL